MTPQIKHKFSMKPVCDLPKLINEMRHPIGLHPQAPDLCADCGEGVGLHLPGRQKQK